MYTIYNISYAFVKYTIIHSGVVTISWPEEVSREAKFWAGILNHWVLIMIIGLGEGDLFQRLLGTQCGYVLCHLFTSYVLSPIHIMRCVFTHVLLFFFAHALSILEWHCQLDGSSRR